MSARDLLPPLAQTPRDAREPRTEEGSAAPDETVYRFGVHVLAVPGLPETVRIDDVQVEFVWGPVRTQRTHVRQRHGLPIVFDKHMERTEVGAGERLAIFSIRCSPVPDDWEMAFRRWRARTRAAAGMLAAVLDERVAGTELFEDAVLLSRGQFAGALDMRGDVRSFLPFEVGVGDLEAIAQLGAASLDETSAVARASRLYRRAALEGPTADAFAMLWVAAECFSERRSPSRKDLQRALEEAGWDPAGLPLHLGLLIELRGLIQHRGLEDDARLGLAFYEMEAVVRILIRGGTPVRGGWWPASENPAAFAEPYSHAVAQLLGPGTTDWHLGAMPPATAPEPQHIPRHVVNPAQDPRIDLDPAIGDIRDLIAAVVVDALEWQDPSARLAVRVGLPSGQASGITLVADADTIWLAPERLDHVADEADPGKLTNLVWDLHSLVAAALAQRAGLVSEGVGVVLIEALGAWAQYRRLVDHQLMDEGLLNMPGDRGPRALGKLAGWAAAGNLAAAAIVEAMSGNDGDVVRKTMSALHDSKPGAPTDVLELASRAGADLYPED